MNPASSPQAATTPRRIWDAQTGQELARLTGHTDAVYQATWNQDESRILTASGDDTARIWDAQTGQELARLAGHTAAVTQATWSQDESRILTASGDGTARIWDARTGRGTGPPPRPHWLRRPGNLEPG